MKKVLLSLSVVFILCSFQVPILMILPYLPYAAVDMTLCKTSNNGQVQSGEIFKNGTSIGNIITINRTSGTIKAKYFAQKENGMTVHDRYTQWRNSKNVVLASSGAYASGFDVSATPIGITVDNGNLVNTNYDTKMDGLVIVEQSGGVRISNIEDGNLKIRTNNVFEAVDVKNSFQRTKFLKWCQSEYATVFQTHLLIYDNKIKVGVSNSSQTKDIRRLLVLAKDTKGELFHIILYTNKWQSSLYEIADYTLKLLNTKGYQILSAINLDAGGIDVFSTSTSLSDCSGSAIVGASNKTRSTVSNLLTYYAE